MHNNSPFHRYTAQRPLSRREFLWQSGGGLGGIALASMLGRDALGFVQDNAPTSIPPAASIAPRAKRVVQLFMA